MLVNAHGQTPPSQVPPDLTLAAVTTHIDSTREIASTSGVAKSPTWVAISALAGLLAAGCFAPSWFAIVFSVFALMILAVWAYAVVVPVKRGDYTALWSERGQLTAMIIHRANTARPGAALGPALDAEAWRSTRGSTVPDGHLGHANNNALPESPRPLEVALPSPPKEVQAKHGN